jgi:hypothetical protein
MCSSVVFDVFNLFLVHVAMNLLAVSEAFGLFWAFLAHLGCTSTVECHIGRRLNIRLEQGLAF